MASVQEVINSLSQRLNSQQGINPPPLPGPLVPQASPFMLHGQSEVVPPIITQTIVSEDVHAHMDRPKQQIRQIRVSDSSVA